MTKSVFLSACGDPFLALFVMKLWKDRWYDEVDKFYICYNNHAGVPQDVVARCLSLMSLDKKVHIIYHPHGIGNGMPITEMTKIADTDLVMLLEDDGFIFSSGIVKECFQKIESDLCDVVGSSRFSCGDEIGESSKNKYQLDYSGYGDVGPNFWPNFFFCKRSDLLRTDLNFGSISFIDGQYCKELNHTFKTINHGDTFVWACIQLRALGLRFQYVPQHKADPFEIESKEQEIMNWHQSQKPFGWIHGGSLSSGFGGYISGRIPDVSNESAKQEIESRVAFWELITDIPEVFTFGDFRKTYREGIANLIVNAGLNTERIKKKMIIYRELMRI